MLHFFDIFIRLNRNLTMTIKGTFSLLFLLFTISVSAQDLYWIGDSGDWNNPQNWSYTSGGVTANVIPSEKDNVFFDKNSITNVGSVVSFNNLKVNSLYISTSNSPSFLGSSIEISGDLTIKSPIIFDTKVILSSTEKHLKTIHVVGNQLNSDLYIRSGKWELGYDLVLGNDSKLLIESSEFKTNGFGIKSGDIIARHSNLDLSNSILIPLKKIDLSNSTKKGVPKKLIQTSSLNQIALGHFSSTPIVLNASNTCGSLVVNWDVTSRLLPTHNGSDISCNGLCDGELTVSTSGSTGPFSYKYTPSGGTQGPATTTTVYSGLCPGNYAIEVTDSSNVIIPGLLYGTCTVDEDINEPPVLNLVVDLVLNPSCHNVCDAEAFVRGQGGTGQKTLNWTNGQVGENPDSLCFGLNTVTLTDSNNCTLVDTVEIFAPSRTDFDITITPPTCAGDNDAALLISNESGGNGGPYTYAYNPSPTSGQNTNNGVGFSAGNVTISVFDTDGCQQDSVITIIDPPILVAGFTDAQDLDCFGVCNGQVSAFPTGGVPGYTFEWFDNVTGLTTNITDSIATGLCAGEYFVVITDANGCSRTSGVVTINEPLPFNLNLTKTDVTCLDSCTGVVFSMASGGTLNYSYSWINIADNSVVGTTPSVSNLCAGFYELTVTDGNNCISEPDTIEVLNGLPLDIVFTSTPQSCYDICDGSITATPTNQTGFTYSWTNSTSTGPTVAGICASAQYIVTVTSDSGCVEIDTFDFVSPDLYDISTSQTDLLCFGESTGTISVTVNSGAAGMPYTYNWVSLDGNPITGQGTPSVSGLLSGDYTVTIADGLNCDTTLNFTLTSPPDLIVNTADIIQISCFGFCDGQISALPSGGTIGYTFEWVNNATGTVISNDSIIMNLCAGDYYLRVTDANGCKDSSAIVTIIEPPVLSVTTSSTDISCNGICDGTVSALAVGGTPNYSYVWSNTATNANVGITNNISGLCAGEYRVIVTDATGCSTPADTVQVGDALPFSITLTGTDPNCNGFCDGAISATATNGIAPLTWDPIPTSGQGTSTANYNGLCSGFYTVSVTDDDGCIAQDTLTLFDPLSYDITTVVNDLNCFQDNSGSISVTVNSGGNIGAYTYAWLPGGLTGAGTNTVSNLSVGPYQVTISDGFCDTTLTFTVSEPSEIIITPQVISQVLCFDDCTGSGQVIVSGGTPNYLIQWDDPLNQTGQQISGLCTGVYRATVTDDNGCTKTDSITITEPTDFSFNVLKTDVSCFGECNGSATIDMLSGGNPPYTVQWNDPNNQTSITATNLCAGTYQATITDVNNCDTIISVTIVEPTAISFMTQVSDTACFGSCNAVVSASATGGTGTFDFEWYNTNSNISIGTGTTLGGLCPGFYYAIVIDGNNCMINTDTIEVVEYAQINISTTQVTNATCGVSDGSITVNASGGAGGFMYNWNPGPITGQGTTNVTQLAGGVYQVIVTDANACTDSLSVPITSGALEQLLVNGFDISCNGLSDGIINVNFTCLQPNCSVEWFNENGQVVGNTNMVNGVGPGIYFVELTNGLGCTTIDSITIIEPDPINANITSTDIVCNGDASGTATITAMGGTGTLLYNWSPIPNGGQGTNQAVGLTAGTWSVVVSDANNCNRTFSTNISEPDAIVINNIDAQDISCAGINDGSVFVSASGGTPNLSYNWFECGSSVLVGTNSFVDNLPPGDYFVEITDGNGCILNSNCITVQDYNSITANIVTSNSTCHSNCNGKAVATPSGGNGVYFYQWQDIGMIDIPGQTSDSITGICQGTYFLEITDGNGCVETFGPVDLTQPNLPWDVTITETDVSCFGFNDGSGLITVNAGNTAPYFYDWDDPQNQMSDNAINLPAGTYNVLITDQANCDTTVIVVIDSPPAINTNAVQTDILCATECTGQVVLSPSGGVSPYNVSWTSGAVGLTADNLCAGPVTASILDDIGCTLDTTFNIAEPLNPLTINSAFSNGSQCTVCNGSATVNISGGTTPYTFVWSEAGVTGQGTNNVTGLCAGVISVTVTDANGCSVIQSFIIEDIDADTFTLTTSDASCFNVCDGSATIVPNCTVPNCTQAWYDAATGLALSGTGTTINSLCQGDYIVELTNGVGCISGQTFTIQSPDELILDAVITDVTCSGDTDGSIVTTASGGSGGPFTFNWTPIPSNGNGTSSALNLGAGDYTLQLVDGACSIQETYEVRDTTPIAITIIANNVTCNGLCNGNITATVSGGFGNYTYQWLDNGVPIPGATGNSIFDLCIGSYSVTVTDANGCSETLGTPVVITQPNQVTVSLSHTDVTCFGQCDGTVTAVGAGGVGPYIYNWYNSSNNLIGQPTATAVNLCPDDYYVVITDDNNCSVTTSFEQITEPPEITFTVSHQDINCFGDCDATAEIIVGGGSPTFTFEWKDDNNAVIGVNNTISNLCSGSYTIEATDMNGCSTGIIDVNILSPGELDVQVLANNADCNVATGSATTQVTGGTQLYTYQWLDDLQNAIVGETNSSITNITSGIYYVIVTDANSCDDTVQVEIFDNPSTTIQVDEVNNPTCFGASDGSIEISIVGINLPLSFQWNPGGLTVEDPSGLSAGTYNLTVTDALGCESFFDTTLIDPAEIQVTPTIVDALCGECNGEISVALTGGSGTYNLNWNNGSTTNSIQNLCAGIYELTVEDDNGCELKSSHAVTNSASVTAEAIITPISCFNECDGEITINVLTGTAPFTVDWLNDGSTGVTQQNLCADTYFINVTDAEGCVFPMVVELENPNELLVTSIMSFPNCGLSDGEISVISTGGVLPHTYVWNTTSTQPTISNLSAGVYELTVTSNNGTGCSQDFVFNLSNVTVPQVTLNKTDILCNGDCDGEISSIVTGGTPTYNFQWYSDDGNIINGENNSDILNQCAGVYTIEVTDANGCVVFASEEITEPDPVIFNSPLVTNVDCFGDCNGSISVNAFGGILPYTFVWDDPNAQTTPIATNLCDGTYTITLTDGNNCQETFVENIVEPALLEVEVDATVPANCKETLDGEIQATISGGTPNYTINWTSSTGQMFTTEDIIGALPMTYFLLVTDQNGCTVRDTAVIDTATIVIVDAGLDTILCNLDETTLIATSNQLAADYTWFDISNTEIADTNIYSTGGLSASIYEFIAQASFNNCDDFDTIKITVNQALVVDAGPDIEMRDIETSSIGGDPTTPESGEIIWTPSIYLNDTTVANPIITEPQEDTWYVVKIVDSLGCFAIDSMYVEIIPELKIPEGISPNNDGKNDTWIIDFKDDFPDLEVSVYNRWGNLLFYDNNGYLIPWDGTYKGKELPVGTYFYVVNLNSDLFPEPFVGPLTIVR